jgi:hypothetical protein
MSTLIAEDRNGQLVEIGDVVAVIDEDVCEIGIVLDFQYPFVDPIKVRFADGYLVSRSKNNIERVTDEKAVLWKLENL